jgi:O-antigen/teichoic acid export membrane protein
LPDVVSAGWTLVAAVGLLLVVTWLQDAYFLAEKRVGYSLQRNLVFAVSRLLVIAPVMAWNVGHRPAVAWALALALSAAVGVWLAGRLPARDGRDVPTGEFLASANRNVAGGAAEFLPGLLLTPIVLALEGAEAAGVFAIAWTIASLLFLACSAVSRSALAAMVHEPAATPKAIRRAASQATTIVLPTAVLAAIAAPWLLALFGMGYAREGTILLGLLCASALVVAPSSLYLAVLRAKERTAALVAFPIGLIVAVAVLAPPLADRYGLEGVAVAWIVAQTPWGLYSSWKLWRASAGVMPAAPPVGGRPHLE